MNYRQFLLLVAFLPLSLAFTSHGATHSRQECHVLFAKRGRGSFKKEVDASSSSASSSGMASPSGPKKNWITVPRIAPKDLTKEENKVQLIETRAIQLIDQNTNPAGAVSVLKYKDETYCFSASCPTCKIPLTKAKAVPPSTESGNAPRLVCDLCKSTYNLRTGEKLESNEPTGFFGGIAKAVLQANKETGPLPVYSLGEKDKRVLISLD